jgi:hypothetical protein
VAAEALCADGNVAHSFVTRCLLVSFTMTTGRCSVRIMATFTQLAPAPPILPEPFTDRLRLAVAAYPAGPLQGLSPHAHRIRPALLPDLVRRHGGSTSSMTRATFGLRCTL